ncbi:M20/M25/M40 family metallo-hydrolase [Reichenbachiella ulvae]|uniref:Carboxypeptidase Q n=1 Tax=Reichenbachiella ulvae TaxID=2980104 RepID=A0ABT3CTY5_9BACT|nr:M20/M25/M40 family metallo-hydrolase [Reichenbachiella ulvae]MCV9387046.1 M20/M25/M40 family metallo-hydrolase [Reichenbachiella ulvae]
MKNSKYILSVALFATSLLLSNCQPQTQPEGQENPQAELDIEDTKVIKQLFDEALTTRETYQLLDHLCNQIGTRLSGSEGAAQAVDWTEKVMSDYGFDKVYKQDLFVPNWKRGDKEVAKILGSQDELTVLALGMSVATPEEGLTAPVVQVQGLEDVKEMGREAIEGKIVFYNRPTDQRLIRTGAAYGGAVDQRVTGPAVAAQYGAVAVVIRSVGTAYDDVPHTGTTLYMDSIPKIPAAALGFQSADRLAKALEQNPDTQLFLKMNCQTLEDAPSHNVIGELTGTEFPDQIITIGGHLDSWDVGQGAHDDGAGCMQSIQVLRLFQKLGIQPKHTIRAVMFMNEENGTRGGKKYAELAEKNNEQHLIALESDAGAFTPRGFGVTAEDSTLTKFQSWLPHFDQNTIGYIKKGGGGVDIGPLHQTLGTPTIGFMPDSQRMFDVHHSANDVFSSVHPRELELGTASMAGFIYLIDKYGL